MTTTWRLGEGAVALDDHGAPTANVHDRLPINRFLSCRRSFIRLSAGRWRRRSSRPTCVIRHEPLRGWCAFLYPSCVDGVATQGPIPLDTAPRHHRQPR